MMCLCGQCASCLEAQGLAADGREPCLVCGNAVGAGESFCSDDCEQRWMHETKRLRETQLLIITPASERNETDEAVIRGSILRML